MVFSLTLVLAKQTPDVSVMKRNIIILRIEYFYLVANCF